ncbi:MAG: response regulator transcription factor [Bacteroidales bacterium]
MRILVIEDEPKVVAFLKKGLEENGFEVDVAFDGQMGEKLVSRDLYDLIILDIIIPGINGIELCRRIREKNIISPVLMLSALGTTDDKLEGFDAGADDYLVKPFEFKELVARINALTKRVSGIQKSSNSLKIADLELDLNRKVAKRDGKLIELTAREFALLEYFMLNRGKVMSRADISEKVWDISFDTGTNVVDVYVNILRRKIEKGFDSRLIHTRIGMGYIFDEI